MTQTQFLGGVVTFERSDNSALSASVTVTCTFSSNTIQTASLASSSASSSSYGGIFYTHNANFINVMSNTIKDAIMSQSNGGIFYFNSDNGQSSTITISTNKIYQYYTSPVSVTTMKSNALTY